MFCMHMCDIQVNSKVEPYVLCVIFGVLFAKILLLFWNADYDDFLTHAKSALKWNSVQRVFLLLLLFSFVFFLNFSHSRAQHVPFIILYSLWWHQMTFDGCFAYQVLRRCHTATSSARFYTVQSMFRLRSIPLHLHQQCQ